MNNSKDLCTFSANGDNVENNSVSNVKEKKGQSNKHIKSGMDGYSSFQITKAIESTQWRKWHNANGGHGFTAEDANALEDYLRGYKVEKTGIDNSLHGPDRISNGILIQSKYYNSAYKSVNSAFQSPDGTYLYPGQVLEVAKDQYDIAVQIMAEKIRQGKVPGVNNPAEAVSLIKKGYVTYEQAVKITKAGNWESLKFDIKNQVVTCTCVGGLSFVVSFAMALSKGTTPKDAFLSATKTCACTVASTMVTGVVTQQILRTSAGRSVMAATQVMAKKGINSAMKTSLGKKVVEKTVSAIGKKSIQGVAARNVLVRTMSSNVATAIVTGVVTSIPDTVNVVRGKITPKEYGKKLVTNGASIGGGCIGSWSGAAIGTMIFPGVGTAVGAFIGGVTGGIGTSSLMAKLFRK